MKIPMYADSEYKTFRTHFIHFHNRDSNQLIVIGGILDVEPANGSNTVPLLSLCLVRRGMLGSDRQKRFELADYKPVPVDRRSISIDENW